MAPVKNPNHNTGTVPKSTQSASSSSSSVLETSPSGSSCISSDPNVQSTSIRSNGGGLCVEGTENAAGIAGASVLNGNVCGMGNITIASSQPAVGQPTTVPQSGGIGAVGGAMANAYVLRKNTEIVAPIRRELKDLNDYFLSVTESSSQSSLPNIKRQNHHYHHRHQPPVTPLAGPSNLDGTTCFDFDHFPDNPRSCYPVRPIPRRTSQSRDIDTIHHHGHNHSSHSSCGIPISNSTQAATVGVVNPTSLGITNEDTQHPRHTNPFVRYRQPGPSSASSDIIDIDDILLQRYKYIQYCIKLANKSHNKNKDIMVNENNENEIIVNSTSLEDVASSETTERAQSVTSIHSSIEPTTPTYEELQNRLDTSTRNIQSMKEQQLQLMRLQDQAKQHLAEMETLRSQSAPLRRGTVPNGPPDYENIEQVHTDMSSLVGRMKNLTTFIQNQNELSNLLGDDGPELMAEQQTLQQKLEGLKSHRDEMKSLILELHDINRTAERRAYEQHLQQQQKQSNTEQPSGSGLAAQQEAPARIVPIEYSRVVPIELVGNQQKHQQRQQQQQQQQQQEQLQVNHVNGDAPLQNGNLHSSEEEAVDDPATAALIQQKMSDIQTMKNQLSRLKSMMETVKLIEERTEGTSPREIGLSEPGPSRSIDIPIHRETTPKNTNTQQRAVGATAPFDKDRTPVQDDFIDDPDDPAITDKIHILNEVTRDLRSQAMSLASERERIRVLKEEIIRRKAANEAAAAAAAANCAQQAACVEEDKNANRDRGSPSKMSNKERNRDILEAQYEAKKKEFEEMCQHLQSNDSITTTTRAREDDEEEDDDLNANDILNQGQASAKPDLGYYYPQSQGVSCNSSVHGGTSKPRGKESADSGAADVHGAPSCEAASIKSGSSRSFSMPPPMRAMSNREASWRKTSQEHFDHFGPPNAPSTAGSTGQAPPPMAPSWNPYYFYNAPYSPHFAQPPPSAGVNSDCICQANPNSVANGVVTPAGSMVMQSDPVLLQQFIQTQQMLINSVCQCNQMLWHQQREIDHLNSTIHVLQDRLLSHTNGTDLAATHRSESVPPAGTVQNNLCPSLNRAQSEQPHHFPSLLPHHHLPTIMSQSSSSASSFHRRNICNIQQQQQQQLATHAAPFNFSVEQQASGGMYSSAVNNLCAPIPPMANFNNIGGGVPAGNNTAGAPIFMHHHNNTQHPVHNNNSNLLNAAQQQPQPTVSASATVQNSQPANVSTGTSNLAGSALNNQVPPGNRANNYWDNFRSYSRQNLLSSNSCKSNEEQNHNQHQQQLPPQQQPLHIQQQQQQHQQEPPNLPIFTNSLNAGYRTDSSTNNLNPPSYDNKYLHTFRNRINANSSMHSGLVAPVIASSTSSTQTTNYSNMMNIAINQQEAQQQQGANANGWSSAAGGGDAFEANEQLTHDLRNMNLNFGNNEPNKVPMKPSSLRRSGTSGNRRLRHTLSEPGAYAQQQQVAQHPDGAGDFLTPGLFSGVIESLDTAVDDTSDEIKRNLLVNALKSEKFTTKFYESLKEDVFRRIETLLRGKDSDQQFFAHLYRDNNIAATHEPLRKLYLNEVRSLSRPSDDLNETESNNGENEDEEDEEEDDEKGAKALENHNILNNNNSEAQNALGLNAKDIKHLAGKFVVSSNAAGSRIPAEQTIQFPDYELIRYISAKIHEGTTPSSVINDALLVEIAKMTATAIQKYSLIKCQKKELTDAHLHISPKKIYAELRGRLFPRDRDRFLMWYQRYLATVLYVTLKRDEDDDPQPSRENNNNAQQSRNANQNGPQGAFAWMDIHNIYVNAHQARKSNIPIRPAASGPNASTSSTDLENKIENNSSIKQQQVQHSQLSSRPTPSCNQQHRLSELPTPTTPSNNIMNEDLAEADQICSSTNSTMQGSGDVHPDDNFLLVGTAPEPQLSHSPENAEGQLISIPSESQPPPINGAAPNQHFLNFFLDEAENNENPEEENRHLTSESATLIHPLLADSDNAEEDGDGQNQRPESSLQGAFGTDPLAITGGSGKRNSVP